MDNNCYFYFKRKQYLNNLSKNKDKFSQVKKMTIDLLSKDATEIIIDDIRNSMQETKIKEDTSSFEDRLKRYIEELENDS